MKHVLLISAVLVLGLLVFLEYRAKNLPVTTNDPVLVTKADTAPVSTVNFSAITSTIVPTTSTSTPVIKQDTVVATATPITKKTTTKPQAQPVYTRIPGVTGPLYVYNEAAYNAEVAQGKLVLLFYYAKWCPICAVETAEALYPAINTITDNRFIAFRVNFNDFDTTAADRAIAKKFQIPYQHSKVFVHNGTVVLKDLEQWDRAKYDTVFAGLLSQL